MQILTRLNHPIQNKTNRPNDSSGVSSGFAMRTLSQDKVEFSSVSFKGASRGRFPMEESRKIMSEAYNQIVKTSGFEKKQAIANKAYYAVVDMDMAYTSKMKAQGFGDEAFWIDRRHEAINPAQYHLVNGPELFMLLMESKPKRAAEEFPEFVENFDDHFKSHSEHMLDSFGRYDFFIDRGLDKKGMSPSQILDLAMESAKEKARANQVKVSVTGRDILDGCKDGIQNFRGQRVADYNVYCIFSNILNNAVKYTQKGSVVAVDFAKKEQDGRKYLAFYVTDAGIGFPKEESERILECGGRASNALSSGIEGTGLGLFQAAKNLEMICGKNDNLIIESPIVPHNAAYPGTRFTCLFPDNTH